jgi:hypothetical protein
MESGNARGRDVERDGREGTEDDAEVEVGKGMMDDDDELRRFALHPK